MGLDIDFYHVKPVSMRSFRKYYFLAAYFENLNGGADINGCLITVDNVTAVDLYDRCQKVMAHHGMARECFPESENFAPEYNSVFFGQVDDVAHFIESVLFPRFASEVDEDNKIMVDVNF